MKTKSTRFSTIQSALLSSTVMDCAPHLTTRINDQLNRLKDNLDELKSALGGISEVNGALVMVLQLLAAAHADKIAGDNLHCLLAPLQGKLAESLEQLNELL